MFLTIVASYILPVDVASYCVADAQNTTGIVLLAGSPYRREVFMPPDHTQQACTRNSPGCPSLTESLPADS